MNKYIWFKDFYKSKVFSKETEHYAIKSFWYDEEKKKLCIEWNGLSENYKNNEPEYKDPKKKKYNRIISEMNYANSNDVFREFGCVVNKIVKNESILDCRLIFLEKDK